MAEYSFNRHVSYCRRAKAKRKNRPRSCRRCYVSKTKCSLSRPECSRCQAQGLECIYEGSVQQPLIENPSILQQQKPGLTADSSQTETFVPDTLSSDCTTHPYNASSSSSDVPQSSDERNANDSNTEKTPFSNSTTSWQTTLDYHSSCLDEEERTQSSASTELLHTYQVFTTSKFAAGLLSQAISAFPQMMLRRQTFPPFIHAHWHLPSLPETLANCMSIAQLFATRTTETRPFLWRTIGTEVKRIQDEVRPYKRFSAALGTETNIAKVEFATLLDLQNALQSVILFVIMAIVDQDSGTLSLAPNFFLIFKVRVD